MKNEKISNESMIVSRRCLLKFQKVYILRSINSKRKTLCKHTTLHPRYHLLGKQQQADTDTDSASSHLHRHPTESPQPVHRGPAHAPPTLPKHPWNDLGKHLSPLHNATPPALQNIYRS